VVLCTSAVLPRVSTVDQNLQNDVDSGKLVRRPYETPKGAGSNKEADDAGDGVRESH
jgi:hypothetical protein